jgi:hypothetical protein
MCVNMAARLSAIGAGWSVVVLTAACGGNPAPAPNSSASAAPSSTAPMKITDPYSPTIDPAAFSATIDNPYLPSTVPLDALETVWLTTTQGGPLWASSSG